MKLTCKDCGAPIKAADMNLDLALARCHACDAVFSFAEDLGVDPVAPLAPSRKPRPAPATRDLRDLPVPEGIELQEEGGALTIRYRWFGLKFIALALFCLFWDGFLVFWYGIAITTGADITMFLGPLAHVAVGVGLTWYVVAGMVNRTTLTVRDGELQIDHGPIPWPGKKRVPTAEIAQLYFVQHVRRGNKGSTTITYQLHMMQTDGVTRKLATGLDDPEYARFLEHRIEHHLGLQDRPIEGQFDVRF